MATSRGRENLGDMVRTALIFLVIVVAVVAFLPKRSKPASDNRVDYSTQLSLERNRAPFHVYAPIGLPAQWVPTHVITHVPDESGPQYTFDLGFYLSGPNAYVALEQSNAPGWVQTTLGKKARQTGVSTVGETTWQTWTDAKGNPALIRDTADGSTVIVDGKAATSLLKTLALALR